MIGWGWRGSKLEGVKIVRIKMAGVWGNGELFAGDSGTVPLVNCYTTLKHNSSISG